MNMLHRRSFAIIICAAELAACVPNMGRLTGYGAHLADAKVAVGTHHYSIWIHPSQDRVLIERSAGEAMSMALKEGSTHRSEMDPAAYWRAAADAVLVPLGCRAKEVDPIDFRTAWDATYSCEAGINARSQVASHRVTWRAGLTVPPPGPPPA